MTIGTATPAGHRAGPDEPQTGERHPRMVLYLDFTCAWSYLASRRAAILQLSGGPVFDVRAVEHASRRPGDPTSDSLTRLRATTEQVAGHLLTGEELPYALAGFVPHTQAAVPTPRPMAPGSPAGSATCCSRRSGCTPSISETPISSARCSSTPYVRDPRTARRCANGATRST